MTDNPQPAGGYQVRCTVNGQVVEVDPQEWTLARFLRDGLGISAVKVACGEGSCGACTVLCDGEPVPSCVVPLGLCDGKVLETACYLSRTSPEGRQVAELLTARSAMQCGFCTPGLLCTLTSFVKDRARQQGSSLPAVSRENVAAEICAHLCRCTGYVSYLDCAQELVNAATAASADQDPSPAPDAHRNGHGDQHHAVIGDNDETRVPERQLLRLEGHAP